MITHLRLALVALVIAAGAGVVEAGAAQTDAPPSCVSHDVMAARLRAEGFTAPAANNFAHFTSEDCLSAAT